jgi:hypothetical protein
MIYLGEHREAKPAIVRRYCEQHSITEVKVISPQRFEILLDPGWETIDWPEVIMYRTFYRLLREIGPNTLVVVNECLRTQNRSDLTLNCIRHFLSQTTHSIVFQWLPVIQSPDDFMILVDFATKSRFKGVGFANCEMPTGLIAGTNRAPAFSWVTAEVGDKTRKKYATTRDKLFKDLGAGDPHTIPRQLHLLAGQERLGAAGDGQAIARNNRFGSGQIQTYREVADKEPRTVIDFPHNFIDFADWLCVSESDSVRAVVTELKVDQWYRQRYMDWVSVVNDVFAAIHV